MQYVVAELWLEADKVSAFRALQGIIWSFLVSLTHWSQTSAGTVPTMPACVVLINRAFASRPHTLKIYHVRASALTLPATFPETGGAFHAGHPGSLCFSVGPVVNGEFGIARFIYLLFASV